MKQPIEFTETEKFLIAYYRTPSVSAWWRTLAADGSYIVASIFFIALHITGSDIAFGFIGYGILVYRVIWGIWQARRWLPGLQGIVTKYETRLAELTAELDQRDRPA